MTRIRTRAGIVPPGLAAALLLALLTVAHVDGPVRAAGAAVSVDPGGTHTCAVNDAGAPSCWGWNFYGQLGDGTFASRFSPTAIPAGTVSSIATGANHTCVVASGSAALCWGLNGSGQLGDGAAVSRPAPAPVCAETPPDCKPLAGLTAIAAGSSHTCALTETQRALCWGGNESGQLGDGTTVSRPFPAFVCEGPACQTLEDVSALALGSSHTCALSESSGLLCWGDNTRGQLGDGQVCGSICATPVAVCIPDGAACASSDAIRSVSAGGSHTCAVTSERLVYCWDDNTHGQLGNGTEQPSDLPIAVSRLDSAVAIAAGISHTCGLSASGLVSCWGLNSAGQLGSGPGDSSSLPTPVAGLGLDILDIAAGSSHTCAIRSTGGLQCWGWNGDGRLGDGTFSPRSEPVIVPGFGGKDATAPLQPTPTPGAALVGDADCGGSVNAIDAALVLQYSAALLQELPCPTLADVDASGNIDSIDAALILQFVARLLQHLPAAS